MKVADYMTREVFTVRADKMVSIVSEIMGWARVRHVPVVDEHGLVVGLVSHRDLLRVSLAAHGQTVECEQRQHLGRIPVRDIMQTEVRCIDPEAGIEAAARLMRTGRFGCLPVVDHRNVLLGIITEHDLLQVIEELATSARGR